MKTIRAAGEQAGLDSLEIEYIETLAAGYRHDGHEAGQAAQYAVRDYIESLTHGRADLMQQVADQLKPEPYRSFRQATKYEQKCDFDKIMKFMDSNEESAIDRIRLIFESAKIDIANKIRRSGINVKTLRVIKELPGRAKLRAALQEMLIETMNRGRNDLRKELALPDNMAQQASPNFTPPLAIKYLREKAISLASTTSDAVIAAVRQALQKSIELGETTQAATARLDEVFRPFMGVPGVVVDGAQLEPHRLENIVRTESTGAYNQGRLLEARSKDIASRMRGMEYSAIMDSRTTPVCQALDGKIFEIGDPNLDRLKPPNHFNCRSVLVPITDYDEIDNRDMISPSESGKAIELANKGFV